MKLPPPQSPEDGPGCLSLSVRSPCGFLRSLEAPGPGPACVLHLPPREGCWVGRARSSTKRLAGAVSPAFLISSKKKNAPSSFPVNFPPSKGWWRSHAGASPSVAPWKCLYQIWALCRVPFPSDVVCFLCTLSLYTNPLFSFH